MTVGMSGAAKAVVTMTADPFLGTEAVLNSAEFSTPFGYSDQEVISNFMETGSSTVGGNTTETYTADMMLTFYTTAALTTVAGTATLTGGTFQVLETSHMPGTTGSFSETLQIATFSGTVAGQALTVSLNPADTDTGMASITAGPLVGQFTIDNPITVFGGFAVNGGAFTPTPTISANDYTPGATVPNPSAIPSVPEPATLALLGMSMLGISVLRRNHNA